jgi:ABC-2 type transport system permease protein
MMALVSSELVKLRTTRTFFGVTGAGLGILLLIVMLAAALTDYDSTFESEPFTDLLAGSPFVAIFALVIGILAISTEFRHGTVTPSLLAVPDRRRWAVSKLLANGAAGALFGLAAAALTSVVVLLIFAVRDVDPGADAGKVLSVVAGTVLSAGLMAALGVGLGAIVRNQAGAIVIGLVWLFVLESLLGALISPISDTLTKYGIAGLLAGVVGGDDGGTYLEQLPAALLLTVYAVVLLAAGIALLQRRDVSANSN